MSRRQRTACHHLTDPLAAVANYAAEPVPAGVDATTASYLDRQFNAIQTALMASFVLPKTAELPPFSIPGAIIYLENEKDSSLNGFWGCVADSQGVGQWKKISMT